MPKDELSGFFEDYLNKKSIFIDKKPLQSSYSPKKIEHRDEQINQIAKILAPALKKDKPSNLFVYGKTGTGKTVTVRFVTSSMRSIAEKNEIPLQILYLNCRLKRIADTEYRLIAQLIREMGKSVPPTGLPTDEVYNIFFDMIEKKSQIILLILDEVDQLVKKAGDEIIYNLTRINPELKKSTISIIGISNSLIFADNLDPRVKSSLSEEELVFPPYNAVQIQDILRTRAKQAFSEDIIDQGVIEKASAYAAREHGDARRAIDLLRVAGEVAERNGEDKITLKTLDEAEQKIEKDRIIEIIRTQPKQSQATLYCVLLSAETSKKGLFTGDLYELYKNICHKSNLRPLTQRRISDIIAELDMLGVLNAKVVSKGRYGRTRELSVAIPLSMRPKIKRILEDALEL